jgi:hypothetical protein
MEPLNKKERAGFIFKFAAVFILGILVVLIPFYFIFRMPAYENSLMTKELRDMRDLMKKQKEVYAVAIDSVMTAFDRYDLAGQDVNVLDEKLARLIVNLEEPFRTDTSWSGRMYKNVARSFIDLKKAMDAKIKSDSDLKECQQDMEKLKEEAAKPKEEAAPEKDSKGRNRKKK